MTVERALENELNALDGFGGLGFGLGAEINANGGRKDGSEELPETSGDDAIGELQ